MALPSMPRFAWECDINGADLSRKLGLRCFLALTQLGIEPGSGERPVAIGGAADDAQRFGRLVESKPRKEAKLDELGTGRIFLRQLVQGVVKDEQLVRGFRDGEIDLVEVKSPPAAAALEPAAIAGTIDEDAAHGLGGRGEE